jgi:predicted transcriptional regulator
MQLLWADLAYRGLKDWLARTLGWTLDMTKHWWQGMRGVWVREGEEPSPQPTGFHILPRRWVVVLTLGSTLICYSYAKCNFVQLKMTTTAGVKLDQTTRARLQALGELKDRSPHWLIKRAIAEYVDREERYEREKQEDLRRWKQYQESSEFIDQGDMQDRLSALEAAALDKADTSK